MISLSPHPPHHYFCSFFTLSSNQTKPPSPSRAQSHYLTLSNSQPPQRPKPRQASHPHDSCPAKERARVYAGGRKCVGLLLEDIVGFGGRTYRMFLSIGESTTWAQMRLNTGRYRCIIDRTFRRLVLLQKAEVTTAQQTPQPRDRIRR